MNEKYILTSNRSSKKVTKQTVLNYLNKGLTGSSPLKRGPEAKLPPVFNSLVQAHVDMKQLEGVSETKHRHVKALIGASLRETKYDGMNRDYLYRKFRKEQCDSVVPTKQLQVEERRGIIGLMGQKAYFWNSNLQRTSR